MKSKDLIKKLQELDPSGEVEVCVGNQDIYFAEAKPAYYDGSLKLLIRDFDKAPYYNVVGVKEVREGAKIELYVLDTEEAVHNSWDDPNFVVEGMEEFKRRVEGYRRDAYQIVKSVAFSAFSNYLQKNYSPMEINIVTARKLFEDNLEILWRKDFNSVGSSFNDKQEKYWNDCVSMEAGRISVSKDFLNKDYNLS